MTLPWFKADSDAGYKALTAHAFTESDPAADFLRRAHYAAILATGREHDDLWTVRGCAAHWKVSRSAAFELMKQVRATMEEGGCVGAKPKSVRTTSGQAADKPRTSRGQAADTAPNNSAHLDAPAGQAADKPRTAGGQAADSRRTRVRGVDPGVLGVSETGDPRQEIGEENTNTSQPAAAGPVCAPSTPLPADPAPGGHPPSGGTVEAVPEPPTAPPPPRKPDPVADGARQAWTAYLAHHPTAGEADGKGGRRPVAEDWKRLLGACRRWGADDVTLVLAWAHTATDDKRWSGAAWLRGEVEGSAGYLSLEALLRPAKWAARIEAARAWDAAGRPRVGEGTVQPAAARASPGRRSRACGAELDELLRHYEGEVIDTTFTVEAGPPKEPTWPLPQAS